MKLINNPLFAFQLTDPKLVASHLSQRLTLVHYFFLKLALFAYKFKDFILNAKKYFVFFDRRKPKVP
jgi:hypothetical protein